MPARAQVPGLPCHGAQQPKQVAELLFGRDVGHRIGVSEGAFAHFVAGELTPRFPDGLTITDAIGQWRDPSGRRAGARSDKTGRNRAARQRRRSSQARRRRDGLQARIPSALGRRHCAAGLRIVLMRSREAAQCAGGLRRAEVVLSFADSGGKARQTGRSMNSCTDDLKLVALDKDDIEVVSAHLQDAMVKVADIFWQPREHRFMMALNRFDWMSAVDGKTDFKADKADYRRCRTVLRFERVNACKCRNLAQSNKDGAAQSARRRVFRERCSGRRGVADLLRRRRYPSRGRMPGSGTGGSRRSFGGGAVPGPFHRRLGGHLI